MFDLKPLSKNAIPAALAKAERYRLLNEPMQAASICEDVLRVEPDNAAARVALILALSDEFSGAEQTAAMARARTLLPGLPTEYERAYYSGILAERRALAQLEQGGVSAGFSAYEGLREAMDVVREGGGAAPARQRRRHPALERLRPRPDAQPAPAGPRRRARHAARAGIEGTCTSRSAGPVAADVSFRGRRSRDEGII